MDIWNVIIFLIFAGFGFMGALVLMTFVGLALIHWKESRFARFYYGIPALLIALFVIVNIKASISGQQKGSELLSYVGVYIGFFGVLILGALSWYKDINFEKYLIKHMKTKGERSDSAKKLHNIIHKLMLITGWITVGIYFVDRVFLDSYTLMKPCLIFFGTCFVLMIIRMLLNIK